MQSNGITAIRALRGGVPESGELTGDTATQSKIPDRVMTKAADCLH